MNCRLRTAFAAAAMAVALTLAGCAADATALDAQTSAQWQTRVLAIAESVEAGDHATALVDLAALETEAAEARKDGEISAERASIIQQSITIVRADLEAASVPVPPAPEDDVVPEQPTETEPAEDDGSADDDETDDDNGKKDEKKEEKKDKNGNGNGNDD